MPEPLPLTGLYGKVPAHGDFVRRGLPSSFVAPWDAWLAAGIAAAREALGSRLDAAWDSAAPWRFALPAGACGPDAVAGVMLPSADQVGRRFPITLAVLLPPHAPTPRPGWYAAVEAAALTGRAGRADADALAAALPPPGEEPEALPFGVLPPGTPQEHAPAADEEEGGQMAFWGSDNATALPAATPGPDADMLGEDPPEDALPGATATLPEAADSTTDAIPEAAPPPEQDALALLMGAAGDVATGPDAAPATAATAPEAPDDVLALLTGERGPGLLEQPPPSPQEEDPLAFLIGTADRPLSLPDAAPDQPTGADRPATPPREDARMSPLVLTEAPPPPEGGGWWTGGGSHVPPMVWAMPGLPAAADFIHLLDAAP